MSHRLQFEQPAARISRSVQRSCYVVGILCILVFLFPEAARSVSSAPSISFALQRTFGPGLGNTTSVALGDMDSDGDLDIITGNNDQPNVIYLNDGAGHFDWPGSARTFGEVPHHTSSVAVADMDGDGDLDIIVGNDGEQNVLYLNDGAGHFVWPGSARTFGSGSDRTRSVAVGDLDGDGHFDIVVGNGVDPAFSSLVSSVVYLNDGNSPPSFGEERLVVRDTMNKLDSIESVALGDINGDSHLDIIVGSGTGSSYDGINDGFFLNDGSGHFSGQNLANSCCTTNGVAVGDLNGDHSLDIVTGAFFGQSNVFLNTKANPPSFANSAGWGGSRITSVALGDIDGDGFLDIVSGAGTIGDETGGPGQNIIALNDRSGAFSQVLPYGSGNDVTRSVALGDLDGDGDLDIVNGNYGQNVIYFHNGIGLFPNAKTLMSGNDITEKHNVAVGDMNGDGHLDLISGNTVGLLDSTGVQEVYFGLGGNNRVGRVAVGDMNGDGNLDIIAANYSGGYPGQYTPMQNEIYLNNGANPPSFDAARPFGIGADISLGIAVADMDGDGDLDIITGNFGQPNMVYLNNGASPPSFDVARPFGTGSDPTESIAIGDMNGDGYPDIVTGNYEQPNYVYLNDGANPPSFTEARFFGGERTKSVAVGDVDGDGDLDIAVGNGGIFIDVGQQSMVYLNDGAGNFTDKRDFGNTTDDTASVAFGDVNGDGYLDLLAGRDGTRRSGVQRSAVYLNDGAGNFTVERDLSLIGEATGVAFADVDGDGMPDLISTTFQIQVHFNTLATNQPGNRPATVTITRPGATHNGQLLSTPEILTSQVVSIPYTLADPEDDRVRAISAMYSLDGGGSWRPAVAATGTLTRTLVASPTGTAHTFLWDTFASGVFGQSDNVIFRIVAYPGVQPSNGGVPGPYQRPFASATTFPFRVRGSQVRVLRPDAPTATPDTLTHKLFLPLTALQVPGALPLVPLGDAGAVVYRIRPGQVGTPLSNAVGQPFHTDAHGYLQGRGEVAPGDQLAALQPIAATSAYTVYLTNATPTATGLDAYTVTASGVQTLTVSPQNPLVLFNLSVSLEWDARNDTAFLSQLQSDLRRTSELLYDWTNGQAALGDITVYHAKAHWDDANIRLNASNRLRPSANQGGIAEPFNQIRIGAVWNRFGDPAVNQGEDWPRALAHELGHYAFNLDDNYLGLDSAGKLISVGGCPGAMSDPYRDDYSEFHPREDWLKECSDTLANRTTGQADWETIVSVYPWLHAPTTAFKQVNPGPSRLPLAVTQIRFVAPSAPAAPLATPVFNLTRAEDRGRLLPGDRARAFLFKRSGDTVTDLIDLGRPALDQVQARGAVAGDRLCVYELEAARLGCANITAGATQLALGTRADWHPQLIITPVTSRTLTLTVPAAGVGAPAPSSLLAQVFPSDIAGTPSSATLTLQNGQYQGSVTLAVTSLEGYVHVGVPNDSAPGREIVTDYALGGNPAPPRRPRRRTRRRAPAMSTDGQVIMYGKNLDFANGEFYAIQTATALPPPPAWATFVGQGYRLIASPGAPALEGVALNVSYADSDVATGTANGVSLYRWTGAAWQLLPGLERGVAGEVTAPISQPGLYVLMSSAEIELKAGINLVAYPIAGERPVHEALASIAGAYTTVRSYDPTTGRWLIYTAGAPEYANTLKALEYGKGYEIRVTRDVTLRLRGEDPLLATALARIAPPQAFPPAPAHYYGVVGGAAGFAAAGQALRATIGGRVCGAGQTQRVAGQLVYTVDVAADATLAGCGAPGRRVTITLEGRGLAKDVGWDNQQARELNLGGE